MTNEIKEEPVMGFVREDQEVDQTEVEPVAEVLEGEIVEAEQEELDELAALQEQLEAAQTQADQYLDDLRRERAAFQNYKKRQENERVELRQTAAASVLIQILPALDDLERALEAIPEDQSDQPWIGGILLIQRKLQSVVTGVGVVHIEAEQGQPFDPFVHEAVTYEEQEDFGEGQIIAVVQTGYKLGERVLRPAMVRVAR